MSDQQPVTQPSPIAPAETARHQPRQPLTICGVVAVVFGALGLVLSFIPIINNIAAIFGFVGVVLAIIAIVGTFRAKKRGKVLSIVAAVLSILAIVITLAMQSGATSTVTLGYVLQDDSPVTVDVSALPSMDQDTKVTHTFALQ